MLDHYRVTKGGITQPQCETTVTRFNDARTRL